MTDKNAPIPIHTEQMQISTAELEAAKCSYAAQTRDNSPQLDTQLIHDTLEIVTGLNLQNLATDLTIATNDQITFIAINQQHEHMLLKKTPDILHAHRLLARMLAIAFETGRRYNLLQVFSVLSEEVETLPEEPSEANTKPMLEM